jgi:DNA end-binding protein Ku
MPHAIWKGSLSFGLVSIPIALHPAEKPEDLSFNQLDRRDLNPVGYKRVNKKTEREVPWNQIVRGYQYERGSYVVSGPNIGVYSELDDSSDGSSATHCCMTIGC